MLSSGPGRIGTLITFLSMIKPLLVFLSLCLGLIPGKTLLLLPVQGEDGKNADIAAVNELYREAIKNGYSGTVNTPNDSASRCGEKDCAKLLAAKAGVDEVIFTTVRRLGSKWIFSSTIMDVGGGNAFNQRGTALSMEDLEPVTRRVSDALLARKPVDQVASLDNITAKEENNEPTRRKSLYTTGFSIGYLYPTDGSYSHLKYNTSNASLTEDQQYSQLIRLAWLNSWEFRENTILGFDASMAMPLDFGADINLQYLFKKTDISPFVGGGLGIHYIAAHDESADSFGFVVNESKKRNSGPTTNMQGGMIFFRTYDIHLMARAEYQVTFNSDYDNAILFDVGVVYRPKEKSESNGGWMSFWKYYLIGVLVLGAIGAAAN